MSSSSPDQIRKEAIHRIKAKQAFWQMVGGFVILSLIMTGIWFLSGRGSFWPAWVMFGLGIALVFSGWNAYGPHGDITDADIDAEMRRIKGES